MSDLACSTDFSGNLITEWECHRNMVVKEQFSYTDPSGHEWVVPAGAVANGATIPRPLWSAIGSPFVGAYRRASVVHDYFVGEGDNPDVDAPARKKADRMFYQACRSDGCSRKFATMLYIGVRTGSWMSKLPKPFESLVVADKQEWIRDSAEADTIVRKFWELVDKSESESALVGEDLDRLDVIIDEALGIQD